MNGLGQFVYPDVRVLEATRRLVAQYAEWEIPAMNRKLVERATHPSRLGDVTKEMGEGGREHSYRILGGELADGLKARDVIVARDKSFCGDNRDVLFGSAEEQIRTRLGDEGINIDLDPPQPSPFGVGKIHRMVIPRRWLPEQWEDETRPSVYNGGFAFDVGGRGFTYGRFGLQRE